MSTTAVSPPAWLVLLHTAMQSLHLEQHLRANHTWHASQCLQALILILLLPAGTLMGEAAQLWLGPCILWFL